MQSIGSLLGNGSSVHPDRILTKGPLVSDTQMGVELELENPSSNFRNVKGWRMETDGSLRNGIEYVFDGPKGGSALIDRLDAMDAELRANPCSPTFRCSTHVHMDVRNFDMPQLKKLLAAYCIFEDVMFDHVDLIRRNSNFCTPLFVNDSPLVFAVKSLNQLADGIPASLENGIFRSLSRWSKYSAFNLQPTNNYGSVEFRGGHAMTTKDDLLALINRMQSLKASVTLSEDMDLKEFIRTLNNLTPIQMFQKGLRDNYVRDRDLADRCYSNSLILLEKIKAPASSYAQVSLPGRPPVIDWISVDETGPVAPTRPGEPQGWNLDLRGTSRYEGQAPDWNHEFLNNIGIQAPDDMRVSTVVRLCGAIYSLQGVNSRGLFGKILNRAARRAIDNASNWDALARFSGVPRTVLSSS